MEGELLSLKWNNHRSTFYTIISSLRNKELYTDVTLACEGKFYPAHKLVLSTCSEYFSAVFEQTSCKNPVVILKDILCKDLEFLLDYMYIGEVNVRQSELSSLIKAAECLKIKGLAVPDEEPVKPSSRASASRTDQTRESSPPPKRRRQDSRRTSSPTDRNVQRNQTASPQPQAPSDDPPTSLAGDSTSGTNPLTPGSQAQAGGGEDQQAPAPIAQIDHIKVEKEDAEHEEPDFHQTHSNNYEDSGGGGSRGDGVASEGDTVPDFPDFLQHTIEKEEPIALRDFNPSEFPGPSGLQASAIGPWEGEGSSSGYPGEGFPGASATSSQTQQQQLCGSWLERLLVAHGDRTQRLTCPFCGKVCSRSDKLKLHIRTHTGERPYRCPYCHHRSRSRDDLKRHIRTHTGERPYQCPHCPYRASDPSTIRSHKRHRHPTAPPTSSSSSALPSSAPPSS
ncbi:uncharacterized protein LOC143036544 isoform X10 [Oratosquilla oratoria]|uniref:uncharacterized protein LOC143036544 isoform X10 n=1 Tax=Oratosquilla oratoria TaxID=337810 RepID=UPI003F77067D